MKIAIITLNGVTNFGNRLQNYALYTFLSKQNVKVENYWKINFKKDLKNLVKKFIFIKKYNRIRNFHKFNDKIKTRYAITLKDGRYDVVIVGSDQVWNPNWAATDDLFLEFAKKTRKVSYAASLGVDQLEKEQYNFFKEKLKDFYMISLREKTGVDIIKTVTGRNDISLNIDPTMLLTKKDWEKVMTKPHNYEGKKYILNYFLGNISNETNKAIENYAKKNNCMIINILNEQDPFYESGPEEFLYLEKNAFLICTDSFHSSVFALIFNRPFVVFKRNDNEKNMYTRIDNFLKCFKLDNRTFNGKEITKENLKCDYTEAYKILEKERKKSEKFLKDALDIKDSD